MSQMIRKSQPTSSDVHINSALTGFASHVMQDLDGFVATQVFPNVPVMNKSDRYYKITQADFLRQQMEKRAPGAESAKGYYSVTSDTYLADVWGLHKDVPDEVRGNSDPALSPDQKAVRFLVEQDLITREVEWAANFFGTGDWGTNQTVSTKWDVSATATIISDIATARETIHGATGKVANTLVMPWNVWNAVSVAADVIDRLDRGQTPGGPARVNMQQAAALFEVDRILVSKAVYNTAAEGGTDSVSSILGDNALLCYVDEPGIESNTAGCTFGWAGMPGANPFGQSIETFRMSHLKSDRHEITSAWAQEQVNADLGVLIFDVLT